MGENSKIEWTNHTFNPWIGCQKVSDGCDHCYAEALMDTRYGKVKWGPHGDRKRTSEANWKLPLRLARAAKGNRPRVFCASLSDWLDNRVPQQWREDLGRLIEATPELDWLLLTKRIENFSRLEPWGSSHPFPKNVWLGVTAENQANYDRRWKILSMIPATVRFISHEPALGNLTDLTADGHGFPDWIIMGGETGPCARDLKISDARLLRDVCRIHRIPFFMKQMARRAEIPVDLVVRQFPIPRWAAKAEAA